MPDKKCLFCDGPLTGRKSRDHPFPMWLLTHLGVCDEDVEPTHIGYEKEFQNGVANIVREYVAEQRSHPMQAFVAGGVCAKCNNGWMSDIETRAKPVLMPFIDGQRTLTQSRHDLPDPESLAIARWAVKTAYMIDRATPGQDTVPTNHLHALRSDPNRTPPGVRVFVGHQSSDAKVSWWSSPTWFGMHLEDVSGYDAEAFDRLIGASYKIGMVVGKLLLLVAFFPDNAWAMVIAKGIHRLLWPPDARIGEVPFDPEHPVSVAEPLLKVFNGNLRIVHKPSLDRAPGMMQDLV
ncbi:MAG: hypothetical protein AB1696_06035 [Planctomycetota bacterium]